MKYSARYYCYKCGNTTYIDDSEEVKYINDNYDTLTRKCTCGAVMVSQSAAEQAAKDGFFYCHAKGDFEMTERCPVVECDMIDKCHRRGFFDRSW
jgi:hypothetical protein